MFSDIMTESSKLYSYDIINEFASNLDLDTESVFLEASNIGVASGFLSEDTTALSPIYNHDMNDTTAQKQESIIKRMVDAFNRFIQRLIGWFMEKFHIVDMRLAILMNNLKKPQYANVVKNLQIEAPRNINKLGSIYLTYIDKPTEELKDFKVDRFINNTMNSARTMQDLAQEIDKLNGYVPSLAMYNGDSFDNIKLAIFGQPVQVTGLSPEFVYSSFKVAKKHEQNLKMYSRTYSLVMKTIKGTIHLPKSKENFFPKFMKGFTGYFNRNVTLITSIIGEYMGICLRVFSKMNTAIVEYKKSS